MASLTCTICNARNSKKCSVCESSAYCSVECQRTDWPLHRLLCSSYKSVLETRPSTAHKLGIFFPVEKKVPELRWVKCERRIGYDFPIIEGLPDDTIEFMRQKENRFRNFAYTNPLMICFRDRFLKDGSALNQSIGANTRNVPFWRGPVAAMRQYTKVESGYDEVIADVSLTDLRYAIDFFQIYYENRFEGFGTKIRGVRVNCIGEQKERGMFESVETPRDLPFGPVIELTKMLGFPVRVRKYPLPKSSDVSPVNQPITKLHCRIDPNVSGWGLAPMPWQDSVGSVLMIRADGKDLDLVTAEVLCAFVHSEDGSRTLFQISWEAEVLEDGGAAERAKVLEVISKAGFEKFFNEYRKEQVNAGKDEWKKAVLQFSDRR